MNRSHGNDATFKEGSGPPLDVVRLDPAMVNEICGLHHQVGRCVGSS